MQAPSVLQGTQFPELVSHWGVLASAHWAWEVQPVLTQAAPGVGQLQPDSMLHVAEQPSAAAALPSSQASLPSLIPFPHSEGEGLLAQLDGVPLQVNPLSITQLLEQPSLDAVLSSSHCSPGSRLPLPQTAPEGVSLQAPF